MVQKVGLAKVERILDRQSNSCYLLITCGEPSADGKMEVEFTCSGEIAHLLYLVESAQMHLNSQLSICD